ncbi:uncharacterized protein LOC122253029 [Penaeus japonicus]|uniref:uncharacterized protein LOC122253029 n=1 Tax=Penaeus japonicus TaxID=27405 RepID=UPI001C70E029|nr:uncharacterized protein LOC122253029 [Penaeus japonicus]
MPEKASEETGSNDAKSTETVPYIPPGRKKPRGPRKPRVPKSVKRQRKEEKERMEKMKLQEEKRLKRRQRKERNKDKEKERKRAQKKKRWEALTPQEKKQIKKERKIRDKTITPTIDDQGEEEEFGIIKKQRIRHPRALIREAKSGNQEAIEAIKSTPKLNVRKLKGDGQGAKGEHAFVTYRPPPKTADMLKLEDVKKHVQFMGGGLKISWTDRPGRSYSGIEWMAHRTIEEELALRKKKKKKEVQVPEQSTKLNFKNIDGDIAFQLLANMPTTSKITFGRSCILIYNYATETKAQKDALASGSLSGAIKYINFLNMGATKEGSSVSDQTIGGIQLRANCGLQVVFHIPISTRIMKQVLTDCSSAEIISFGDYCQVDFKSVKEAEGNWKTLQKLRLKNDKNRISFEELRALCVDPESEVANHTSEELKLLENVDEEENQVMKKKEEMLLEIERKKRKMEEDDDEYGQYEMQARKQKEESIT